jgi:mannose-1-phosphate guanylyltransferase
VTYRKAGILQHQCSVGMHLYLSRGSLITRAPVWKSLPTGNKVELMAGKPSADRKGTLLNQRQVWAVVLAGGDGTRLKSLTQLISGEDRPKQFCTVYGGKTLLAQTRARLAPTIHPERTAFVLVKAHEKFYSSELADIEPRQLIVQPDNKGTTAAVMFSLLRITAIAGDPVVAFFPTDHYYSNEAGFDASVHRAVKVAQHTDTLVILGAEAEHAEVEYGWIEPGTRFDCPFTDALLRVRRFWEKPSHPTALALFARGCLWNTFVMVGRASIFLALLANTMAPSVWKAFTAAQRSGRHSADPMAQYKLWASLTAGDFSRQVLTLSTQYLSVLRVGDIGWSDLGTPERVSAAMARSGLRPWWQEVAEHENSKDLAKTSVG